MTTLYVYHTDTNEVHAQYHGETLWDCVDQAEDAGYMGTDEFGASTELFGLILLASDHPKNANY